MTLATHILPTVIIGRTLSTHPYRLRPTDEIIIAQFGRVQGAALVAVRDIYMITAYGRPLTLPSRALQPSVIHALFVRLTEDVRHTHIAYGQQMK